MGKIEYAPATLLGCRGSWNWKMDKKVFPNQVRPRLKVSYANDKNLFSGFDQRAVDLKKIYLLGLSGLCGQSFIRTLESPEVTRCLGQLTFLTSDTV